jgi:hypothetical protein
MKDKLASLLKYASDLQDRIDGDVPEKRKNGVKDYKEFLQRDLQKTLKKIEKLRLEGVKTK